MVKLIGLKKIITITLFLIINLALLGGFFFLAEPLRKDAQQELQTTNGQITKLRVDISKIKNELRETKKNKKYYDAMHSMGFFMKQDLFFVDKKLESLSRKTRIPGFTFDLSPIEIIPNPDAKKAGLDLVKSRITISKISSYLDIDVYKLAHAINTEFPGQTRLHEIVISRNGGLTQEILGDIRLGTPVGLIDAKITFDWLTFAPMTEDENNTYGNSLRR